ncbi:GNAT family N-acetyltransferase [Pseudokineococcus sp. 1T1Z-3]|uniref:GNAT family N-acetyltransferase n=1 Tax=Pseudokineococcus sp. 1T1Z-3 TaxID=3132745 RepID=UPI0030A0BC9F
MAEPARTPEPVALARVLVVGADDARHRALVRSAEEELLVRYGGPGDTLETVSGAPLPEDALRLLAVADETAVGCVAVTDRPEAGPAVGEVKRLWVHPSARRRGLALALLTAAEDAARSRGHEELHLVTGTLQPEALALYEREGWRPIPAYAWADDPMTRCFAKPLRP